jgi:protein-L-isoaspartate(D-aspartate) O-methyltransferase
MSMNFEEARLTMVEQQVRPWDVLDPRVLDALKQVSREAFVSPEHRNLAYTDIALPLTHNEVMMKPIVEGRLLQALDLSLHDEVLEIGTGSGFVTTCLAHLAREVVSIDIENDFISQTQAHLERQNLRNVRLHCADALNWQCDRQFDAIAVTAAVATVPDSFKAWLKPGGRLFIIRGHSPVQEAIRVTRRGEHFHEESLFETDVPYLRGAAPKPKFTL